MSNKLVAALGILVGGLATIFQLCVAFGVNISPDQQTAIASVAGLALTIVSIFFHPATQAKLGKKA